MTLSAGQVAAAVDAVLPLAYRPVPRVDPAALARALASPVRELAADGYASVADQSSVAMFITDSDGLIVDANPATAALLGRARDDVVGLTIADITHPDDVHASRDRLAHALHERVSSYRIEKRYIRGDGTVVVADVNVSLLRNDEGLPVGFFASAVDDTERRRAEDQVRRADVLLRATVDSFPDPWVYLVAVRDGGGPIVDFEYADANDAACEHNGLTRAGLLGRRLLDLLPDHAGDLLAQYAAVVETGAPLAQDAVPFTTAGETRYFANRAVPVGHDGLSFTWRDITEHVRLRNDLAVRATTDPLTGLLNRDGLGEAVRELGRPERRRTTGAAAVLYIDLDGLGNINRQHGHPSGDAVLTAVADRLAGAVRAGDVVARVGGDEFVILAPGADDGGARHLAIKLAQAVTRPLRTPTGRQLVPTISVGVTVGDAASDLEELITRADEAMLARKRNLYQGTSRYAPESSSPSAQPPQASGEHEDALPADAATTG